MSIGIPGGHNLIQEIISSTVLNQIKMYCYLVLFHVSVRVQRTGSRPCDVTDLFVSISVDAVAWGPLAHAPLMWRPCQVDRLTSPWYHGADRYLKWSCSAIFACSTKL